MGHDKTNGGRAARAALGLCAATLLYLALPPAALAGPPLHPPLGDPIGGYPLNHACGTATDSAGDIYVSNAGGSKIEVFDPAGTHLTSITNTHEPCGLAVDSKGNLYVSEKATGQVVRYAPNAYPFSGTPSYGAAATIDSSNAKGIAVDPVDDRLYVAEGNRVAVYDSDGALFIRNERQLVRFIGPPTGGTYKLSFEGQETAPISYEASHAEVQAALEALSTIGSANVVVSAGEGFEQNHRITFVGVLAATDLPLLTVDGSALVGGSVEILARSDGFNGHIAEGELNGATGVAAYTYDGSQHYLSVAEPSEGRIGVLFGTDVRALELHHSIDGSGTPEGELGLAAGAYLGVDSQNGHLLAYDATKKVVNEFEATGQYFMRITSGELADAEPTAIAVDRSGGPNDGKVYVSAGASAGAKLLAFGPLAEPSRKPLKPPLSRDFEGACGVAVDSQGNVYVSGGAAIKVYEPDGDPIKVVNSKGKEGQIVDGDTPCSLAVDSEGNLYAVDQGTVGGGDEKVVLYEPSAYPFSAANPPSYGAPKTIETAEESRGLSVHPTDDRLYVAHKARDSGSGYGPIVEFKSAKKGSALLNEDFCAAIGLESRDVDIYRGSGNVYVLTPTGISVCDPSGTQVLHTIDGSGGPSGTFSLFPGGTRIDVDQSNGHFVIGRMQALGVVEEYEPSGAFVGQYGSFGPGFINRQVALDNSCALHRNGLGEPEPLNEATTPTCAEAYPANGNLYVDYVNGALDVTAFGPVNYREPPVAVTGIASAVGATGATLNGTVDPRGFELEECAFEWGEAGQPYEHAEPCAETPEQIGEGEEPVAVHLEITGIEPQTTGYHFRLRAKNKYGEGEGKEALFGPPILTEKAAQPIRYREATLRGGVDPFGLETEYHFEYLTEAEYLANGESFEGAQSTPLHTLPASSEGSADVEAPLTGLAEGTTYRFRLVAENEAATVKGSPQALTTQQRHNVLSCPNETLRLENNSTHLSDCRAYELVTPADTRGFSPLAEEGAYFDNWLVTPSGPLAGESLAFFLPTTLPGTNGNGLRDAFRATRDAGGWVSGLFSPSAAQQGHEGAIGNHGIAADQRYVFFDFSKFGPTSPGAFPDGTYLRVPEGSPPPSPNCAVEVEPEGGFERLGCGSLDADSKAVGRYVSGGGGHVIFTGDVPLEPEAPTSPLEAIYDRSPDGPTHVVSLLPGDVTPSSNATYQGATEDGSAVVFSVTGGGLYLRRDNAETVKVADTGAAFARISEDGMRVFYEKGGDLYVCDVEAGPCTGGSELPGLTKIASAAKFAVISADGSHAYYVSVGDLYLCDVEAGPCTVGSETLVAELDPRDLSTGPQPQFPGTIETAIGPVALDAWTAMCAVRKPDGGRVGRAFCPLRVTSDGRFLVFQSHADLTPPYEGQGHSTIYRYDAAEDSLLCVSCDPSGAPANAEADLQVAAAGVGSPVEATTLIPNVSEEGGEVFFQTEAALLPEDANPVYDVYEWQGQGSGGCTVPTGCLALISSGQSDKPSFLYSMTPDGHDVFFSTAEKLVSSDITGSPSLYDARVEGGFPAEVEAEPCHGDACQGEGSPPPSRPAVRSDVPSSGNAVEGPTPCPKGRHHVKGRCVAAHHPHRHKHHRRHHRRANHNGRAER